MADLSGQRPILSARRGITGWGLIMWHKHYGTMGHYVREAQQMLEGAEGKIAQL